MNILLNGYLDRNFGDDMMLRITAYYLPQHEFYIDAEKDEVFIPFQNIANIHRTDPRQQGSFDMALTVIGSGFMTITYSWIPHFIREEKRWHMLTKHIPTAVIGCNIGPLKGRMAKALIHKRLNAYDLVTVRDTASQQYLRRHLKIKRIACYPDLVFSLPDAWIPDVEKEGCLGISAYGGAGMEQQTFFAVMADTADRYIRRTGKKVLLFAFDLGQEDDLTAAYRIKALAQYQEMIEIIGHEDNGDHIIYHLCRCSQILSVRFHMMVMAIRLGIAFVPIAYSDKIKNVLQDIGYHQKVFDMYELDAQKIETAMREYEPFSVEQSLFEQAKGHIRFLQTELMKK